MEPLISAKNLLKTGAHFGHRVSRWNPKMSRYIFTKRNRVHNIDLRETIKGFVDAYHFLTGVAGTGKSAILSRWLKTARARGLSIAVTASTGIAASHIDGMTIEEAASALGVSAKTVEADWYAARAWLNRELSKE